MVPNTFSLLALSCFQVFVLVKIMGYYFTAICHMHLLPSLRTSYIIAWNINKHNAL